jgi:hypothetical protein
MAIGADEKIDASLVRELLFDPNGLEAEEYTAQEQNLGKRPDYKLKKAGETIAFCEMKSTKKEADFEDPKPEPGKLFVVTKDNTPTNLSRHVMKAASQLNAVNEERNLPNIMIIVNHVKGRDRNDLSFAIAGAKIQGGGYVFPLSEARQKDLWQAARKIDLFVWVDASDGSIAHVCPADAPFRESACAMLGIKTEGGTAEQ